MSNIWIDRRSSRLKDYSARTKGTVSIVTIQIEVTDPSSLGFLLAELARAQAEAKAADDEAKAAKRKARGIEHRPQLQLTYRGDDR